MEPVNDGKKLEPRCGSAYSTLVSITDALIGCPLSQLPAIHGLKRLRRLRRIERIAEAIPHLRHLESRLVTTYPENLRSPPKKLAGFDWPPEKS